MNLKLIDMLKSLKHKNKTDRDIKEQQFNAKLAEIYKFMQEIDEHQINFYMDFEPSLFRHPSLYMKNKGKNTYVSLSTIGDHLMVSIGAFTTVSFYDCDIKIMDMILNHIKSSDLINELIDRERYKIVKQDLREGEE